MVILHNTNTGVLFYKTEPMDVKPHFEVYKPTEEEWRLGKVIKKVVKVEAHEDPEPEEEVEVEPESTETEIDLGGEEESEEDNGAIAEAKEVLDAAEVPADADPRTGMDGGDVDAAAAYQEKWANAPARPEPELSPQQKGAITRAANAEAKKTG